MGRSLGDILPPKEDRTGIHLYKTRDAIDERGLPRAVGADNPEDLALGHGKTDVHQCLDPAKGLFDVFDLKNGF